MNCMRSDACWDGEGEGARCCCSSEAAREAVREEWACSWVLEGGLLGAVR